MASGDEDRACVCSKSRRCSKVNGHKGRCNSEKDLPQFWETSPVFLLNKRKRSCLLGEKRCEEQSQALRAKLAHLDERENKLLATQADITSTLSAKGKILCVMLYQIYIFVLELNIFSHESRYSVLKFIQSHISI